MGSRHGSLRDLHKPTCDLSRSPPSSLVSDTISHPFLLETAGSLSATPSSHASSPPWPRPLLWLTLMDDNSPRTRCPAHCCSVHPWPSRPTPNYSYHAHAGNAGISLLQSIPSAKVLRPPCNGPSNLVRAGRTSSRLTWPPDCLVSDTTIPSLHLATITTPAVNLSFAGPLFFLSPTHQAQ